MELAMDDPDVFKSYLLSWGHPAGAFFSGKYAFLDFWNIALFRKASVLLKLYEILRMGTELGRNWYRIGTELVRNWDGTGTELVRNLYEKLQKVYEKWKKNGSKRRSRLP